VLGPGRYEFGWALSSIKHDSSILSYTSPLDLTTYQARKDKGLKIIIGLICLFLRLLNFNVSSFKINLYFDYLYLTINES